jgi:hypothetical protein
MDIVMEKKKLMLAAIGFLMITLGVIFYAYYNYGWGITPGAAATTIQEPVQGHG